MPFRRGSIGYARFAVVGSAPSAPDSSILEALAANVLRPTEIGAPPEIESGWVTGHHVYDTRFSIEENVFASDLVVAMRLDTNRVPSEVRRAYRAMAEQERAAASPTGIIGRSEKAAARDDADRQCHEELASGTYRRSKMIPVLWDLSRQIVLAPAFGDAVVTALRDLMFQTFEVRLVPISSGVHASETLRRQGRTRDYEDLRPSAFTPPPPSAEASPDDPADDIRIPRVPWIKGGPEPSDYLGNEFLVWLWWQTATNEGLVEAGGRTIPVAIDRQLDTDCAWDENGRQSLRATGPARMPEAMVALRAGKWPRKMGLMLAVDHEPFTCTIQGDRAIVSGLTLPKPEDAPESPRVLTEQRLDLLHTFDDAMTSLYDAFLTLRVGSAWPTMRERIAAWIREGIREGKRDGREETTRDDDARRADVTIETIRTTEDAERGMVSAAG
ncbi:MAG: hypothetical protein KDA25_01175 [Phycisphaerales bacterium]|nr:hypothetical protein [Phycisphaerales bacterium]